MKAYIQPTVDYITLEVKNDVCVAFGVDAASPVSPTGINIGGSGKVVSD